MSKIGNRLKRKLAPGMYRKLVRLFGEPEQVLALRQALEEAEQRLLKEREQAAGGRQALERELETVRQERLEWMAKESSVRKELKDSQDRGADLLEQVVRLTHQKRNTDKDLLDQKFKTEATPLERTRFEIELTEARGRMRRAEERAKAAEEKLAHNQARFGALKKQAERAKQLESDLAWTRQQSAAHLQAIGAAIARIRLLETELHRQEQRAERKPTKRSYRKPSIRRASKTRAAAYRSDPRTGERKADVSVSVEGIGRTARPGRGRPR